LTDDRNRGGRWGDRLGTLPPDDGRLRPSPPNNANVLAELASQVGTGRGERRSRTAMHVRSLWMLTGVTVVAVGVVTAAAVPATPVPRAVHANVDVSRLHNDEAENAIAINPTDPANIVAM